jgi:hypothetical protein
VAAADAVKDAVIRQRIEALLDARRPGASICPSDVARSLRDEGWRTLMPAVRDAAWGLVAAGTVEVTQRGAPVDRSARGPLRIRRPAPG